VGTVVGNASNLKEVALAVQDVSAATFFWEGWSPRLKNVFCLYMLRTQVSN